LESLNLEETVNTIPISEARIQAYLVVELLFGEMFLSRGGSIEFGMYVRSGSGLHLDKVVF